jgi:L-ascorbate metabolism protein UlaG (beta-lactamase superfamily)
MTSDTTAGIDLLLIGGPTLALGYGGLRFLTDPTFDPPGDYPGPRTLHKLTGPALTADELGPVDVVLLSHDQHADNLDHAGRALLDHVPVTLSTHQAAERVPAVALAPWEVFEVDAPAGRIQVTAVPARHGPVGCEPLTGDVTGFVLRADDLPTVYVSGDNAAVEVVEQVVDRLGPVDLAVLFTGAANTGVFGDVDLTLNRRTALEAAAHLGRATVVPVHAEGWDHFSETRESLVRAFGYAGLADRLMLLEPGRGARWAA